MPGCMPTTTAFVQRQQKLTDYQSNCNIAMVSYFMCAETDEEARRRADGVTFFQFSLAYYSGVAEPRARRAGNGEPVGRI